MTVIQVPTDPRMIIGGRRVRAISGLTFPTYDPATGLLLAQIPLGDAADVDRAVDAATAAFSQWRDLAPLRRSALLHRLADAIEEHAEELILLDVVENGSPIREMRADAGVGAWTLRYFAGLILQLRGETVPGEAGRLNFTLRQPFGVVGRVIPFNHPLMFAAAKIAAPLAAGNTVVIKPSELTSLSALRVAELATDILPPGVLNVVTGTGAQAGSALVRHPGVRRVAFTGAATTGRLVQQQAAEQVVKTVTLELGGKNPIVVLPDADLDAAIDGAVRGMNFTWQGQSCGSTSRLLVHSSLRTEFVNRLAERLGQMRSGPPQDELTETGAIVSRVQYEKVLGYLSLARADGARTVVGGRPAHVPELPDGLFLRPTLLENVAATDRIAQEEIFGPVLVTIPFDTFDEALQIANGVAYGLTAAVFTHDLDLALRFAREVQAGMVWINDSSTHVPGMPFGGFKDSGVGREENYEELASYTQIKSVTARIGIRPPTR